jgi:putative transposase
MFIERLWRTVKYEDIYIRGYETVPELELRRIRAPWAAAASAIIVESVFRRRPRPD